LNAGREARYSVCHALATFRHGDVCTWTKGGRPVTYGGPMPVPDFIVRLRQKIGHDLLWLPGATAVVLNGDEVLLVRRSDNGSWTPVTGIVDPGEHPSQTATREVMEVTGISCAVDALVWVNVTEPIAHANGDHAQYLDHTFRCRYLGGLAHVADDECSAVGWFPVKDLPAMAPVFVERIRRAKQHVGSGGLDEPHIAPETH
jgi:ADP-ribose pyrophosphatase YjhB (NUDIX family)